MESLLREVYEVVQQRREDMPEDSYTGSLFRAGKKQILRKFLEEATEVAIASGFEGRRELVAELADLWFHSIVIMVEEGITIDEVIGELKERRR